MSSTFRVVARSTDSADHIALCGNIDATAEKPLQDLAKAVGNRTVHFDFNQAGRINSMGIALLLRCFKQIREEKDAEIFVRELNTTNVMLFKMTGVFLLVHHEK